MTHYLLTTNSPSGRLLFLLVPDTQNDKVLVLEVVARDGVLVRQHLARIRQPDLGRSDRAAGLLEETVAQRRHQQVQRELRDSHHSPVQLPLRLRRILRQLNPQRDRMLQHAKYVSILFRGKKKLAEKWHERTKHSLDAC